MEEKVKKQNVKVKDTLDKTTIIESGLNENDLVVVEGQIRLKDGASAKSKS